MDYNNKNRQVYRIKGNKTLSGEITPQGAKNEALQVICATLLTPEEVIIHNVPHILDVLRLIELLEGLGMKAKRIGEHSWSFQADDIHPEYMQSREYHQKARALRLSLIHISEPTRLLSISYAVFCLKKKICTCIHVTSII